MLKTLDLPGIGVGHVPVPALRAATNQIFRPPGLKRRLIGPKSPPLFDALQPVLGDHETVVLSEENWIGEAFEGSKTPPYPDLDRRMACLRVLPDDITLKFYIALRHPGDFATSVTAEALRHHPEKTDLDQSRDAWLKIGSPWSSLLDRLQQACPDVPITIWRYEDYRANSKAIVEALIGRPVAKLPNIADPQKTKRPSAEMVRALAKGTAAKTAFTEASEQTFQMFTAAEQSAFSDAYTQDLAQIERNWPGAILHFDTDFKD